MAKRRNPIRPLARLGESALRAIWVINALGHAWILAHAWTRLGAAEIALLILAVIGSLALVPLSGWMCRRPIRLILIVLLIALVHVPIGDLGEAVLVLAPVALLFFATSWAPRGEMVPASSVFAGLVNHAPPDLESPLSFALRRRPPPLSFD